YDWQRDSLTRLTADARRETTAVWTPDSQRVTFASIRSSAAPNLYWQRADGTGQPERLTDSKNFQFPSSWHPDGKILAFEEQTPQNGYDVMLLRVEGDDVLGWKFDAPVAFLTDV